MTILYSNDFETALNASISGNAPVLSTDQAGSGTKSMKSVVDYNDANNKYRCEITGLNLGGAGQKMTIGGTYWLGFRLYVPATYPYSTQGDIFYQVHGTNDTGEASLNPPLTLQIQKDKIKWTMVSDNNVITNKGSYAVSKGGELVDVAKGAWTRFVVQFKIAPGGGGFIKIWINDVLFNVYPSGPTFFNDAQGPYNKFGIYRPAWKPGSESWGVIPSELAVFTSRTLYHDDIKVGDAAAVYADVAPSGGGAPVTGTLIELVNGNDQIAANTELNYATGVQLAGAKSATLTDTDTTINVAALGYPDGSRFDFNTDALTGLSTPATLTLTHAPVDLFDVNPRTWGDNFSSQGSTANYATTVGPFNSGRTITVATAGSNWIRSHKDTGVAVAVNDVIDIWYYMVAGTGGNAMVASVIGAAGNENKMDFRGALSGNLPAVASSQTAGTSYSCTTETSPIHPTLKIIKVRYTAGAAGNLWVGIGPGSSSVGDSVHELGAKVWINGDAKTATVTHQVDIPALLPAANSAPTITSAPTLTRGQLTTITGTGHKAATRLQLTNGTTTVEIEDFIPSSDGTSTTFTVPLTAPTNANQLIMHWAPRAGFDNTPLTWADNAGGVLTKEAYPSATWASDDGATLISIGSNWHRSSVSTIYAPAGETVTVDFFYLLGSSNKAQFSIRNVTAGANIAAELVAGQVSITLANFGSQITVSDTMINGISRCRITFTNDATGELLIGVGPLSGNDGDAVHEFAYRAFSSGGAATVTHAVTMSGTYVPTKKFVWSAANGNKIYVYDQTINRVVPFTGTMQVRICSSDVYQQGVTDSELAFAPSVTFSNGEGELNHSMISSGSVNDLLTGPQGYNFFATNGTYRVDNSIDLVEV